MQPTEIEGVRDFFGPYEDLFFSLFQKELPFLIWIAIAFVLFIFALYTIVLAYHLFRYGIGAHIYLPTFLAYLAISFVLISIMLGSAVFLL
ncbi:MAG: hypothetical protein WDZ90_00535 [Candidatus Paceibacterota bacterium]